MVFYSPTSSQLGLRAPHNTNGTTVASFTVPFGLGSSPFARHYSGNRYYFFFLGVLRYFNSPCWLCRTYEFRAEFRHMTGGGLPHSDIAGSKVVSTYPALIAGNHVLLRLPVPRHPSHALSNLAKNLYSSRCCTSGAPIRIQRISVFFSSRHPRLCPPRVCGAATDGVADIALPVCQRTTHWHLPVDR